VAAPEHVTVLFTDMVGSTAASAAVSPEEADSRRRAHFETLRHAVAAAGGTEVKNLGDGLMVVFTSASSAVSCAVAMQQAVEQQFRLGGPTVGLRVGLSCGEATLEGGDFFGDPVVEAARLCASAEGGQILVADIVRAVAGRRSPHPFRSVGALQLKGLPAPLDTHQIDWEPLADSVVPTAPDLPLPTRLARRPSVGVIGREVELQLLGDGLKRVAAGAGREVVLLAGEPGQGKSTLVAEIGRRADEAGCAVLLGRCDEQAGAPYQAFHEALTHYVAHADEDLLRTYVDRHGGELGRLVPALRQRLGELPADETDDPDTARYLLFAASVGLIDLAARDQPLVLVLDDLHWADTPSLQLLRHIVAHSSANQLLVLGTYRDAELSNNHPLADALAALRREPGVSFMALKGLDDSEVIAFMEAAAGHHLEGDGLALAHAVYRDTDGNPFFVSEVLRHLYESGSIVQDQAGRWSASGAPDAIALPESLRQVIGARVSRLGVTAGRVLSVAAVIGREFEFDLLAEATGTDEDELLDVLDEAHAAALVREVPGASGLYSFSHALIQHTLYDDLGATRRARAHHQVAEALERLCGSNTGPRVGELARHWLAATRPTDAEKAVAYARQAGESALAALAPEEALRYLSQAVELVERGAVSDSVLGIDLLIGLGTAQRQAGVPDYRATLLEAAARARRQGDADRLAAATLANNRGFFRALGHVDTEQVDLLEAALQALPADDSPQRALLMATLCSELSFGPLERRQELARDAKAMAKRLGDPATIVAVTNLCGIPLRIPAVLPEALREGREAFELAEELGDPVARFWAASLLDIAAVGAGQFALADQCMATMRELSTRLQQPMLVWNTASHEAAHAMRHGDPARAEELATFALEVAMASGQADAFGYYGSQLMTIRRQQGRMGELVSLIADVAERNPLPIYHAVLASALLEGGDAAAAREMLEEAADGGFSLPMDTAWLDGVIGYSLVAAELDLSGPAEQLVELLSPYHDQVPANGLNIREPVAVLLGALTCVLGRYDEAERYFVEATELNGRGAMAFHEAHTQLLWARMLIRRRGTGDSERARDLLDQALASARASGYGSIERRAHIELQAFSGP
jgi:class 3 adenylate cyclase/tetratricopeptide (TPR) repeat protein